MISPEGYLSEDTIAAIATATGGALTVVRLSGQQSFNILERMTRHQKAPFVEPRKMTRAFLYLESGEAFDDSLFVKFVNPASYTGEDLVEFHIHGGSFLSHCLMKTLISYGARQALPGEFSFRAVRNGKMNVFQAQAVMDLIGACNPTAAHLALEKLSGHLNPQLDQLATELRKIAALSEVGIDFNDQDIEELSLPQLKTRVRQTIQLLEKFKESYQRGCRLQEGVKVTLVGLPNAGKSTLFNAFLGEDRSIVSELPGTTRDLIREKLTLHGRGQTVTLCLEDTAGLRMTDHPIEKIGIKKTRQASHESDLILLVMDSMTSFEATQEQWEFNCEGSSTSNELANKTIAILTKSDLASPAQLDAIQSQFEKLGIAICVKTSALRGEGITETIQAILEFCEHWTHRQKGELILTRLDHLQATDAAIQHLKRANLANEVDLFASDIRQSLHTLRPLIGETLPDDILGKIFSDFCIGK